MARLAFTTTQFNHISGYLPGWSSLLERFRGQFYPLANRTTSLVAIIRVSPVVDGSEAIRFSSGGGGSFVLCVGGASLGSNAKPSSYAVVSLLHMPRHRCCRHGLDISSQS